MKKDIDLAPKLSSLLVSTGELGGVETITQGDVDYIDKVRVRAYEYIIHFNGQGNEEHEGFFAYYRRSPKPHDVIRQEYRGPPPRGYYSDEKEVHLIFVNGKERKDPFIDIPFP